jgi:hypothetical protein
VAAPGGAEKAAAWWPYRGGGDEARPGGDGSGQRGGSFGPGRSGAGCGLRWGAALDTGVAALVSPARRVARQVEAAR